MEAYTDFAGVYDIFMDETPYREWCAYVRSVFERYRVPKELVLDLGCGTGTMTELLAGAGYDMIGIDSSQEMLNLAITKRDRSGHEILYLCQDMREFELYGTVRAVISLCDSVNYILEPEELADVFSLVNNYLDPGGIFLFDFNTDYKYREIIGDSVIAENRETCSFIWENYFHEDECINEYDVTVFVEEEDRRYRKFTETHYQRGYTLAEMKELLAEAGMEFLEAADADTKGAVTEKSERIYVTARERGKEK
ncbi:MAG: class I SAM-dependent methyltransferase [Lachnospiraceae bacterium]|nr:class I SAM-dependent methyltransferase [Lachnospiraceae bacterium]